MMMVPCAFWPLAEHASFGQNCCDASIGSVSVCICYSMPMDACFFNHSFPFHRIVGFYRFPCTPAMAAGLTDHVWSVCELLSYHIPPPPWVEPKRSGRPGKHAEPLQTVSKRPLVRLRKGVLCSTTVQRYCWRIGEE